MTYLQFGQVQEQQRVFSGFLGSICNNKGIHHCCYRVLLVSGLLFTLQLLFQSFIFRVNKDTESPQKKSNRTLEPSIS